MDAPSRPPLDALTSLRFVTALHVFLFHLEAARIVYAPEPVRMLASVGYVGVSWFFVLSGFILTYAYEGRTLALVDFWRARLARVYPAYFVSLCFAAPLFIYVCFYTKLGSDQAWIAKIGEHIVLSASLVLVLMQAWVPAAALSFNPVGWSLSAEAFFYLAFPLLLPALARLSRGGLYAALLGAGLASIALSLAYVAWMPDAVASPTYAMNDLTWLNVLRFNPLVRLPEFVIGICGALLFLRHRLSERWAAPLVAAGLGALLAGTVCADRIPYAVMHNGLLSLPFVAIIYGVALRPRWSLPLEWRWFRGLGEISYSFFLTHGLVIAIFFRPSGIEQQRAVVEVLACLVIALVLASALHRWVEEPFRRRSRLARRTVAR